MKCLHDGRFMMLPMRKTSRKGAVKAAQTRIPSVGGVAVMI